MGIKFTVEGFSQERAIALGLSAEDLVILRWFVDFWPSPKMVKMEHDGKSYALISYKGFIEQMPIIGCNKRTIARKFKRLVDSGVLENATIKEGGSFSVYRFGENYDSLVQKCATGLDENGQGVVQKCATGLDENGQPKTHQLNTRQLNTRQLNTQKEHIPERSSAIDFEAFQEIYNSACPNLPICRNINEKRKKAIRSFMKDYSIDDFREICQKANQSDFLAGKNDRGWRASIDFLLRTDKAANILEGAYESKSDFMNPYAGYGEGDPF